MTSHPVCPSTSIMAACTGMAMADHMKNGTSRERIRFTILSLSPSLSRPIYISTPVTQ